MKKESVVRSYRRYSHVYDFLFGPVLASGRSAAVKALGPALSLRVLEIGVGTGLALPLYDPSHSIWGIDLSPEMLEKAGIRAARLGRDITLEVMDAQDLRFKDSSFDACVAMYVASVAPDPAALVREMTRVTRPGGRLVMVNHFSMRGSLMEACERLLSPWSGSLGFEPLFYLDDFIRLAEIDQPQVAAVGLFGYWRILSWERKP